jgi:hypothetical protein
MLNNPLPFLMLGILLAACLAKTVERLRWVSLPVALVFLGFVASEIWVRMGMDAGLRWEILRDLVFYLLLPVLLMKENLRVVLNTFFRAKARLMMPPPLRCLS